jgi:glycosyltransferase involved in cell wall biosynthesis
MNSPRLLQIFNRSIGGGGMDVAVERARLVLSANCDFRECTFDSSDWTRADAPSLPRQALSMLYNSTALNRILAVHEEFQADAWIVHNWEPVVSSGIYSVARRARVPIIQFVHNFRPFSVNSYLWVGRNLCIAQWRRNFLREVAAGTWQQSRLKTAWLALVLASLHWRGHFRAVKAWVTVSEFMRDQSIKAGLPAADVFALRHSWVPLAEPPRAEEGNYYLFLGRLIEEKGVRVLLEVWDLLARQAGAAAPRLVIGGDGPLANSVREAAGRNSLLDYRGTVGGETKESLLAGCRALIVPSLWREALGLVVYEAFDHAKPVLAARSGGLTEMVQSGKTGLLHTPGSALELRNHVLDLERAPQKRVLLGRTARTWLLADTSEDLWWSKFSEIVKHALSAM